MKIDKAIEVLTETRNMNINFLCPDRRVALRLGIEALKAIEKYRRKGVMGPFLELPGETPEEEVKS